MTGADLARFLIRHRSEIEGLMHAQLGAAAPRASSPEAELLRRFRTFVSSSLMGSDAEPALEGVRVHDRRAAALLESWVNAAASAAGPSGSHLQSALQPLQQQVVGRLRQTSSPRRAKGAARAKRRAVSAAIDRVADSFIAIDTENTQIVDANPAAGALLGVPRDALLGVDAMAFIPESCQRSWWTEFESMSEGCEPRRFDSSLQDNHGQSVQVTCSITRFATRERTLALIVARPL